MVIDKVFVFVFGGKVIEALREVRPDKSAFWDGMKILADEKDNFVYDHTVATIYFVKKKVHYHLRLTEKGVKRYLGWCDSIGGEVGEELKEELSLASTILFWDDNEDSVNKAIRIMGHGEYYEALQNHLKARRRQSAGNGV